MLRSADPRDRIKIQANYLADPDDVTGQIRAVKFGLRMLETSALQRVVDTTFSPSLDLRDEDGLERFVRSTSKTVYHPVGTCRMGTSPKDSVVDLDLKVHGIDGLRVVDCSVFPSITSGNTNAPTIALAEKAADHIRGRA